MSIVRNPSKVSKGYHLLINANEVVISFGHYNMFEICIYGYTPGHYPVQEFIISKKNIW